jgi:Putative zinc-finger
MRAHPSEARLHDHADQALAPHEAAELERHLAECAACAAQVERIRSLTTSLAALAPGAEPARDLWPALAARLEAEGRGEPARVIDFPAHRRAAPAAVWLQRAAAAAVLFVGGIGVGRATLARAADPSSPTIAPIVVSGPSGGATGPGLTPASNGGGTPRSAMQAARQVQRAGTDYVAAVGAFAELAPGAAEFDVQQGRDATLSIIAGAAQELLRVSPADSAAAELLRVVSAARAADAQGVANEVHF